MGDYHGLWTHENQLAGSGQPGSEVVCWAKLGCRCAEAAGHIWGAQLAGARWIRSGARFCGPVVKLCVGPGRSGGEAVYWHAEYGLAAKV